MFQRILYCFHFLRCRMFPRLFQFFYRIRSIIHRQSQISLYLCDICGMYLEAVFRFYVLLNHFVGHFFFGLIRFGSFSNTIYRNLALALSKLHINVDITVGFFVGQKNYRLHVSRTPIREEIRMLEQDELVIYEPRKSAVVRPQLSEKEMEEVYTIHAALQMLTLGEVI